MICVEPGCLRIAPKRGPAKGRCHGCNAKRVRKARIKDEAKEPDREWIRNEVPAVIDKLVNALKDR